MALVIEDGSIVRGATSYVTVSDAKDYALIRGYTFPSDDTEVERLLIRAIDYLEGLRDKYQGSKVQSDQTLQWPRSGVTIDNEEFLETAIPKELRAAQCQLAVEMNNKVDPLPTSTSPAVKRERVDVVETEYAVANGEPAKIPSMPKVDALLAPLFKAGGFSLRLIRV